MHRTPIIIITKDNPEYLYVTLKSLSATELYDNPILILDNSSILKVTKQFYFTSDEIDVTFDDWTNPGNSSQEIYDKMYAESFLLIPDIKKIKGLKRKFQVISTPYELNQEKILFYAMKTAFTLFPEANSCCILDDNIIFNKYWFKKTISIYNDEKFHSKVGIVSVFSEVENSSLVKYRPSAFSGKMMFINKNLYKEMTYIGWFKDGIKLDNNEINYVQLERIADSLGYITLISSESYIQSLEKRNLAGKNKLLKYQNNFKKPVAWNKNML